MMGLTDRQTECLDAIRALLKATGKAPTCGEIGDHLGISKTAAFQRVLTLEERGVIRRIPGKHRALEIVDDLDFLAPDLQRAVRAYAEEHHIKPETAVAEAVRAYCGVAA